MISPTMSDRTINETEEGCREEESLFQDDGNAQPNAEHKASWTGRLENFVVVLTMSRTGNDMKKRISLALLPILFITALFVSTSRLGNQSSGDSQHQLSGDMRQALDKCRTDSESSKCVMFSMKDSGLGSQLLNMYANSIYLNEMYGYGIFMVDEAAYEGYRIDGKPVLTAYFSKPFLHLEDKAQYNELDSYLPDDFVGIEIYDKMEYDVRATATYKDMVTSSPPAGALVMVSLFMFHKEIKHWMTEFPDHGYARMVQSMCPGLQFNSKALSKLQGMRQQMYNGLVPDDLHLQSYTSVAFHVRRTDKLAHESALFPASVYVQKFIAVLEKYLVARENVKVCFLATDDFSVTTEMQRALSLQGFSCHLVFSPELERQNVTSAGDPSVRYQESEGLVFMTELSVLLEATYFVGTFNSNIGALTSVLRGCPGRYNSSEHYANSFGVDKSRWFLT